MAQRGTVQNGAIVPDDPTALPDGTPVERTAGTADGDEGPPPPRRESREEFLQSLRQADAEFRAGKGKPIGVLAAELKREFGVPASEAG